MSVTKLRVGSLNIGTMQRKEAEFVDVMFRRKLDICCLQETRLPAGRARMLEIRKEKSYKLFWSDSKDGNGGVGIMIDEIWIDNVIEIMRAPERIMLLRMRVDNLVLNIISAYAPQCGRSVKKRRNSMKIF